MFAVECVMCGSVNKPIPKSYEKIYLYDNKEVEVGLYKCCHCNFQWRKVMSPFVCLAGDILNSDNEIAEE